MVNRRDTCIYYYLYTPYVDNLKQCRPCSGYINFRDFYVYQYYTNYQFYKVVRY